GWIGFETPGASAHVRTAWVKPPPRQCPGDEVVPIAAAGVDDVDTRTTIQRHRHRLTDPNIVERGLVYLPVDERYVQILPLDELDLRIAPLERLYVLLTQELVEVQLTGTQRRQLCRGVRNHEADDLVHVRLPLAVIVRVLLASEGDAGVVPVEDERAAANNVLRHIAVRLHHLA